MNVVVEIKPYTLGWRVSKGPRVRPVFPKKGQAINYVKNRGCWRRAEIHILDLTGNIEETIPLGFKA